MITPGNVGDNPVKGTLEFMRNMWSGMPGMVVPTLSVDELDKKISDLKTIEAWLNLNMNMLRSSIQALEVQRATIATLHSMGDQLGAAARTADSAEKKTEAAASGSTIDLTAQMSNATAWWGALQDQFRQAVNHVMNDEEQASAKADAPSTEKSADSAKKSTSKKVYSGKIK